MTSIKHGLVLAAREHFITTMSGFRFSVQTVQHAAFAAPVRSPRKSGRSASKSVPGSMQASVTINQLSPISTTWLANVRHSCGSNLDALAISSHPAPRAGAIAALDNSLLVDLGDDIAITREQRLGGAHLGA
jgi:hypothetical protein